MVRNRTGGGDIAIPLTKLIGAMPRARPSSLVNAPLASRDGIEFCHARRAAQNLSARTA